MILFETEATFRLWPLPQVGLAKQVYVLSSGQPVMVNSDKTRLAKRVRPFDPNTTHFNNGLTRHDPFDLFIFNESCQVDPTRPVWPKHENNKEMKNKIKKGNIGKKAWRKRRDWREEVWRVWESSKFYTSFRF
jgi:hypothetical protein